MQRARALLAAFLVGVSSLGLSCAAQATHTLPPGYITAEPGTSVSFMVLRAEYSISAKVGDPIYMQTSFPVTVGDTVVIPAGTFLQGTIQSLVKPTSKSSHAMITIAFAKVIWPNGYAALLHETQTLDVQVNWTSDILLDNGTSGEMKLTQPLLINETRAKSSLALANPVKPGSLRPGTRCVPTEGTPGTPGTMGTPDIVIPGSPDTVIPGIDGGPDTVIPGSPSTTIPGIPATPDDPGTPGTTCANPPLILSITPAAAATTITTGAK